MLFVISCASEEKLNNKQTAVLENMSVTLNSDYVKTANALGDLYVRNNISVLLYTAALYMPMPLEDLAQQTYSNFVSQGALLDPIKNVNINGKSWKKIIMHESASILQHSNQNSFAIVVITIENDIIYEVLVSVPKEDYNDDARSEMDEIINSVSIK